MNFKRLNEELEEFIESWGSKPKTIFEKTYEFNSLVPIKMIATKTEVQRRSRDSHVGNKSTWKTYVYKDVVLDVDIEDKPDFYPYNDFGQYVVSGHNWGDTTMKECSQLLGFKGTPEELRQYLINCAEIVIQDAFNIDMGN